MVPAVERAEIVTRYTASPATAARRGTAMLRAFDAPRWCALPSESSVGGRVVCSSESEVMLSCAPVQLILV